MEKRGKPCDRWKQTEGWSEWVDSMGDANFCFAGTEINPAS